MESTWFICIAISVLQRDNYQVNMDHHWKRVASWLLSGWIKSADTCLNCKWRNTWKPWGMLPMLWTSFIYYHFRLNINFVSPLNTTIYMIGWLYRIKDAVQLIIRSYILKRLFVFFFINTFIIIIIMIIVFNLSNWLNAQGNYSSYMQWLTLNINQLNK